MNQTYDAVIVGAGVVGASVAYHLAQRDLKVLLLERQTIASGATGASSGLVRMHYDTEVDTALAWRSFAYFVNWRERVGGDCGFVKTGFLQIVRPELNAQLRGNVELHQRMGINTEVVTAEDARKLAPMIKTHDFELVAYEPDSGYADPSSTTNAFIANAKSHGAVLLQDCEVKGIRSSGGKVQGVDTSRGSFDAPIIVNCAGIYAGQIGALVGLEIPIGVWHHDVAVVKRPLGMGTHPTVIDDVLAMYFRPEGSALTLIGLEDDHRMDEAPDSAMNTANDFVFRAIERICERMEGMDDGALHSTHSGRDGITPDQHAIIDQAGPDGFYMACGFSGTGFKTSPAVGACVSEMILDGEAKLVDISALNLGRFARGESIQGEFSYGSIWK